MCRLRKTEGYESGNTHRTIDKGRTKATRTHKQMACRTDSLQSPNNKQDFSETCHRYTTITADFQGFGFRLFPALFRFAAIARFGGFLCPVWAMGKGLLFVAIAYFCYH